MIDSIQTSDKREIEEFFLVEIATGTEINSLTLTLHVEEMFSYFLERSIWFCLESYSFFNAILESFFLDWRIQIKDFYSVMFYLLTIWLKSNGLNKR